MSGNSYRFFPDARSRTALGAAVRPLLPADGWLDRARRALSNHLSATSNRRRAQPEGGLQCSNGDVNLRAANGWSASGLLVHDLKAAGALPSSAVAKAGCLGSLAIMLDLPCLHIAPSDWRSQNIR